MPTNATGQASDSFKEFVEKVWEKTGKSKEEFLRLFSVESGNFEQRALYSHLAELSDIIEESEWSEAEKANAADVITMRAFGYGDSDEYDRRTRNYNEKDRYRPANMPCITFPRKTFNIVGARTSRGKTSFLVSLSLDIIERTDRQCVFLTHEETWEQVETRFIGAMLFEKARETGKCAALKSANILSLIAGYLRHPESCRLYKEIREARERFRSLEQAGRLRLYDMKNRRIDEVEQLCRAYQGAFVLVDYATKIRARRELSNSSRLDQYNDIADSLENLAAFRDLTVICGAQVRRADSKIATDSDYPDLLNDTQLKECGRLEEEANTIIFLGKNTKQKRNMGIPGHDMGEPVYFWKIIKNRGGKGVNNAYLFDTTGGAMGYSYMKSRETPIRADGLTNKEECKLGSDEEREAERDIAEEAEPQDARIAEGRGISALERLITGNNR